MSKIILPEKKEIFTAKNFEIFVKPTELMITQRRLEAYLKLAEIKAYYQRCPVKFMHDVLGAELFDAQAYLVTNSWATPFVLWVCTRGLGKTTVFDLILMAKGMLFNNYWSYIASGTGEQAISSFNTLEKIANKNIESMTGLTGVFKQELEVKNASGDGFIHNPSGHKYSLYNGSFTKTLNSNIDKKRGERSNMVVFDECGWLSQEMMNVYGAYTVVNKDLKLGGNINVDTIKALPREIRNQLYYISSASSIDTAFYEKYRDFSKQMLLGNPDYFVAEINCDVVINATVHGKLFPQGLLSQELVDSEMRNNPEKALREYYCQFTKDGGVGQIIKRALITRNSYVRPPVLSNTNNKRKFVFAYDPARSRDNSILGIGELIEHPKKGLTLDIANVVSFADIELKKKTPMMAPDQIKEMQRLLLQYNGEAIEYDNIDIFLADAGAGGGGNSWVRDYLISDFKDEKGETHRGLIDKEYAPEYVKRYPDAVNKLKLIEPTRYKSDMFEAAIKMIESDLVSFTDRYDNKGYINIIKTNEKVLAKSEAAIRRKLDKKNLTIDQYEEELANQISELNISEVETYKLSPEEEVALVQIDAMKEEIVNICRTKRDSGKDVFKLPTHKDASTGVSEATMNDDRAYVLAMMCWWLSERRLEHIKNKKVKKKNTGAEMVDKLIVKAPKR